MKLIEKKCENCGANLTFDKEDKQVTCEYCGTNYDIQRDISNTVENIEDEFDLVRTQKLVSGFFTFSAIMFIIPFIIFIIVFITALIIIFNVMNHF